MAKPRDLILLYIGKRISFFSVDAEKIEGLVYFSAYSIEKIANYRRFKPNTINYDYRHSNRRYPVYEDEGLVVHKKGTKKFALTEKGEQYCNTIIDGLSSNQPEIISPQSGFNEIQNELYHSYGLNWLAKDYFEFHNSSSNDLDNWRKGFSFDLPSIKSRQELRREGLIGDIKARLENEKRVLIIGQSGSSKSTILMELMCDYFDAGYEIFYNGKMSELKNIDGLVNFIESRLRMNEKVLVAVDDAHNHITNSIFYVVDKLSNSELTKDLRFIITARQPEFKWLLDGLDKVQEELRKSIRKLTGDVSFIYPLPPFTKEEIRDFIKLYLKNVDDGEADKKSQEVYDGTRGDPIMVKFAVLGEGLEKDIEEMVDRYLGSQQEMKTMLICSLLDISNIAITDRILKQCGVLENAYLLDGSILHRNAEGLWRTKHPRWDAGLFSILYGNNTRTSNSKKQVLKDSLGAIFEMREETVTYSAIMTLYDMARTKFVPIELFEVIFKESISHKPMILSKEKVSSIFVLISEAYYVLDEFQSALDSSNEALKWDSRNAMAYDKKGVALTLLERDDEAVECFDKALDIDPGLAPAWMHKGNTLDFSGRPKEALMCYDKVLEIDPHYLSLILSINRGGCFYNIGKYKQALVCFDKVLNIINSEKLSNLLELLGLNERDRLLFQIPSYASHTYRLKGTCLSKLEKHEEAMRCIDKALEIDPNDKSNWYEKGNALIALGKYKYEKGNAFLYSIEAAVNAYNEVLNICPDGWLDLWIRKGSLHALLHNYEEAVDCYDHALKINSELAEIWYLKGQALLRLASSDAQYCLAKAKKLGYNIRSLKKN